MSRDDLWDRASFDYKFGPTVVRRDVSRVDLILERGPSRRRMLALTLAGGIGFAMLCVWAPAMIVLLFSGAQVDGRWLWLAVGIAALVFWLGLFWLAVRESIADRRYARRL